MLTCFVPGCKTRYRSCSAKANMFKAPSDPVQLEKWRKAIVSADRTLTSDDYVCHLHFASEHTKSQDGGHPELVEGAVPHIFPSSPATGSFSVRQGDMQLSSPIKSTQLEVSSLHAPETSKRSSTDRSFTVLEKTQKLVQKQTTQGDNVSATDDSDGQSLFSELCKESDSLCPESWTSINDSEHLCFAKLQILSGHAVVTASVSISKNLDVQVFHGGLAVSHSFPDHVFTKDEVKILLKQLVNSQIFIGNRDEHLVDTKPAALPAADHDSELDLGAVCNPNTSVTDMMDDDWNDMKYIEIAPINESTDCSYSPDLPDVHTVDHEPVCVKFEVESTSDVGESSYITETGEQSMDSQHMQIANCVHAPLPTICDERIEELVDNSLSQKTKRIIENSVAILSRYLHARNTSLADLYQLPQSELNKHLRRFYPEVRKKDGSLYNQSGFISIRYGLQKHFRKKCGYDIINDTAFCSSAEVFTAVLDEMKKLGKCVVRHKQQISQSDLNKLYHSSVLCTSNPVGLQNKVFVDMMLHLSNRGRDDLRRMKKSDFHIGTDSAGERYVAFNDCLTESRYREAGEEVVPQRRMYHLPGNPRCPVMSFEKYLAKLNSNSDEFWQRPAVRRVTLEDMCWYETVPVGVNTLATKMKTLSVEAELSTVYTNHCLRATLTAPLEVVSGRNSETSFITQSANVPDSTQEKLNNIVVCKPDTT